MKIDADSLRSTVDARTSEYIEHQSEIDEKHIKRVIDSITLVMSGEFKTHPVEQLSLDGDAKVILPECELYKTNDRLSFRFRIDVEHPVGAATYQRIREAVVEILALKEHYGGPHKLVIGKWVRDIFEVAIIYKH